VRELVFQNPRFDALRSALYHTERRKFLDLLNRIVNFSIVLLGAGAAAKWAKVVHIEEAWIEFAIVFFATAQLVFDFGGSARVHEFLQRRYYEVLAEIEGEKSDDEHAMRRWSAKLVTLMADEPMTMRALDAIAYNKALDAIVPPAEKHRYRQVVSRWQIWLRHVLAFQNFDFAPKPDNVLNCDSSRSPQQ
jgi:hypothetical protein